MKDHRGPWVTAYEPLHHRRDLRFLAASRPRSPRLLKDVTPEHLAAAVRLVNTGDALLAPSITRRLVERFAATDQRPDPVPARRCTATWPH